MFTGIVEEVGELVALEAQGTNRLLRVRSRMSPELRVDQSVSHNGACLTITSVAERMHEVVAVKETLERTNLNALRVGDGVNLERSLRIGDRLDGHMVQGHVDATVRCLDVRDEGGSWVCRFALPPSPRLLVEKGSICINGVSLTIATLDDDAFAVAVIPYTHGHTTFKALQVGSVVNVEYDVLGKYVQRLLQR
jgi:riboflavin synthase